MNFVDEKVEYKNFQNGDNEELEEIIKNNKNNIIYFIFRYVKDMDTAEDIFQNVVLYILEHREQYNPKYSLKTYLYTIAKSKSLNYIKKNKELLIDFEDENVLYIEEKLLEDIIVSKQRKDKIIKVMSKMSQEYQQVIYLTIIEGLSYEDVSKIMEKSISQIKNLLHRARVKMKKLLIEEKVIEMRNNKIVKLLFWILIIGVISSGIVYASIRLYKDTKEKANLIPIFTGKIGNTDYNSIWVGTFNLAWENLIDEYIKENVEFEEGNTVLVNELNKKIFTKEQLSSESYYIKVGKTSTTLKNQIISDISTKFGINQSEVLDNINFENATPNSLTIYSMICNNFEFLVPFDRLDNDKFNGSEINVKYFGINNTSDDKLKENVEVLFYNTNNDFAIKLNTKENEEIILYRTNENNKSFDNFYKEIQEKSDNHIGSRKLNKNDEVKIPYINLHTIINYDDLCGKYIKGTNGLYIQSALQNINFTLNEKGGQIISEAGIKGEYNSEKEGENREFYFDKAFFIFIKEKESNQPYMALKIDNIEVLETLNSTD